MILFDSNLLVHAHLRASPYHGIARALRDRAAAGELHACLTPQVLCEFYAVVTNGKLVDPPLTPTQATGEVLAYWTKSRFQHILPTETTMARLFALQEHHVVSQQRIFDAWLVATMLDHGVRTIYTQNVKDFAVYPELHVINPFSDLQLSPSTTEK
jgi:predicted nucleic acid-binding protein